MSMRSCHFRLVVPKQMVHRVFACHCGEPYVMSYLSAGNHLTCVTMLYVLSYHPSRDDNGLCDRNNHGIVSYLSKAGASWPQTVFIDELIYLLVSGMVTCEICDRNINIDYGLRYAPGCCCLNHNDLRYYRESPQPTHGSPRSRSGEKQLQKTFAGAVYIVSVCIVLQRLYAHSCSIQSQPPPPPLCGRHSKNSEITVECTIAVCVAFLAYESRGLDPYFQLTELELLRAVPSCKISSGIHL